LPPSPDQETQYRPGRLRILGGFAASKRWGEETRCAANGDDVGTVFDDGSVSGIQSARDVQVSQDGEEKFYWELAKLADGITRRDGHVGMSPIVKRTPCCQLRIIEGIVADVLLRT
jgi:hypothetical protein